MYPEENLSCNEYGDLLDQFENDNCNLPEIETAKFQASLPRLHVISYRKLGSSYPYICHISDQEITIDRCEQFTSNLSEVHDGEIETEFSHEKRGLCDPDDSSVGSVSNRCHTIVDSIQSIKSLWFEGKNILLSTRNFIIRRIAASLTNNNFNHDPYVFKSKSALISAEYIMLSLLSKIANRDEASGMLVGYLPINIFGTISQFYIISDNL